MRLASRGITTCARFTQPLNTATGCPFSWSDDICNGFGVSGELLRSLFLSPFHHPPFSADFAVGDGKCLPPPNRHFCSAIPLVVWRVELRELNPVRSDTRLSRFVCEVARSLPLREKITNGRAHLSRNNRSINARLPTTAATMIRCFRRFQAPNITVDPPKKIAQLTIHFL